MLLIACNQGSFYNCCSTARFGTSHTAWSDRRGREQQEQESFGAGVPYEGQRLDVVVHLLNSGFSESEKHMVDCSPRAAVVGGSLSPRRHPVRYLVLEPSRNGYFDNASEAIQELNS